MELRRKYMDWITLVISVLISVLGAVATSFLTLGKYKEKVDRLEKDNAEYRQKLEQLGKDGEVMKERVQNIQKAVDNLANTAKANSPIKLTDKGWEILNDSGCYKIFEENKDIYLKELEEKAPRSQYDVQEKAYALMSDKYNAPEFRPIEAWAFNHGKTMDEIIRLCGYPLRDYYFEKHPEIVNPKEQY